MKKKILSLVLVISMLASLFVAVPASADNGITISMPEITLNQSQGTETVEIPMVLEGNTGVLGVQLEVKYGEGLTLTNVAKGDALTALSFTKPGDFSANPVKLMWDGETGEDTSNGTIAVLTFEVPLDDSGEYPIEIIHPIIIDEDMYDVDVTFVNGRISVNGWHEHSFGDWEKYDANQHKKQCQGCGYEEIESHNWDDGVVTVAPTHQMAGVKTYTCTECDETFTETVTSPPHQFKNWTMTGDEWHEGICECGEAITEQHTWDEGVVTIAPTAEADGIKTYTCGVCNGTKTEIIEKLKSLTFEVKNVTIEQGERKVEVPISIKGNLGVLGVQLQVKYGEGLVLTDVKAGEALSSLSFTAPGNFGTNPIKMMWDGQDYTDDTNGVIATLTFTVSTDEVKDYEVEITNAIVVDGDVNPVETTFENGKVSVIEGEPVKGTTISVSEITVDEGEGTDFIEVPVSIEENKGVLGVQLQVKYAEGLMLKEVRPGDALSGLTCTVAGDLSANPIKIMWDGQDEADSSNGTIAVLVFELTKNIAADYEIEITDAIVVDENINPVDVTIIDGKITATHIHVHEYGDWLTDDDNHKKECSCGYVVTEAHKWDDGVVTQAPTADTEGIMLYTCSVCKHTRLETIKKIENIKITVSEKTVKIGAETRIVEVPIIIDGNPGVLGVQLGVKYAEGLTLKEVRTGDALTDLTCTVSGDLTANPIEIMWDGQDEADASNGTIAILKFEVPATEIKDFAVEITNAIVVDGDVNTVSATIKNGKISVEQGEPEPGPVITVSDVIINQGEGTGTVEVPVVIEENTGVLGVEFGVKYAEGLTLKDVKAGDALKDLTCTVAGDLSANPIKIMWDGQDEADSSNGVILTLTFEVPNDKAAEFDIEITDPIVVDEDVNSVSVTVNKGKISVHVHEYGDWVIDGDVHKQECSCGDVVTEEHVWDVGSITQEPTCTNSGVKTYTCSVCGATRTEEILAIGHNDDNKDHKCDNCGETLSVCADENSDHTCDVCGETLSVCADVDNDHNCDICGTKKTECADENSDHACDICGETLSECSDADNDHNCDICGTKLTECADENSDHACDICGETLSDCADENSDHACDICGETLSECSDADNDHNCDICGTKLTECADENNDHACDVCGEKISDCADVDNDHNCDVCGTKLSDCAWDEGTVTLAPTCTVDGVKTYTCTVCSVTKTETIVAIGHKYGDWTIDVDVHKKECACGDVVTEEHVWNEGVITQAPTADKEGVKTYTCTVCSATKTKAIDKTPVFAVPNVTISQGEGAGTVEVPVVLTGNTGIIGMELQVKYAEGLTLTGVTRGDALTSLAFTKPGDLSANPVKILLDGDSNADSSNGVVAKLIFSVPREEVTDYEIEIAVPTIIDGNLDTIIVTTENGKISVLEAHKHSYGSWTADIDVHKKECSCGDIITEAHAWDEGVVTKEPTENQVGIKTYTCSVCGATKTEEIPVIKPDEPIVTGTTITVSDVTVAQGAGTKDIEVPIIIEENAGMLGMTLKVKYGEGLILKGVKKGDALTSLAFTKPGDLSANPVNILWDGEMEADASNGVIAILTFTVQTDDVKDFSVEIVRTTAVNENLDTIAVTTINGKISIVESQIHEHEYSDWIDDGENHKKVCLTCGDAIVEAHAWDKGVVTKEPAYPQKGEKTYTCTVCGKKKTEVMEWVYNPGDPTDDGEIDTRDIISIRRYIAGGYNVVINLAGADADKDGMIDSRDIILVRRYLAGGYGVVLK